MEEEAPAKMEDVEATPTMPLLCVSNRVLFPEETLPMHINNPHVRTVQSNVLIIQWNSAANTLYLHIDTVTLSILYSSSILVVQLYRCLYKKSKFIIMCSNIIVVLDGR